MRPAPPPGAPVAPPRLRAGRVPVSGPINRDLGRLVRPPSRGPARGRLPAPRCGGGIKTFSMGGGNPSFGRASLSTGSPDSYGLPVNWTFRSIGRPDSQEFSDPHFFSNRGGPFLGPSGLAAGPGTGPPFVQGGYLRTSTGGNRSRGPPPRAPSSGAGEAIPRVIPEEILSLGGGGSLSHSLSLSLSPSAPER